jgi:hypothetical protein
VVLRGDFGSQSARRSDGDNTAGRSANAEAHHNEQEAIRLRLDAIR